MTCRLNEMNWLDATYEIARRYPGGVEALAHAMGMSAGVLYKKLEAACETHFLRADELEDIIRRCASNGVADPYRPLRALAFRFNHVAVQLPDLSEQSGDELHQMVVRVFAENGDVARVIQEATADKSAGGRTITARELTTIEREIEQAIGALAELRERARAQAQQPQLRVAK